MTSLDRDKIVSLLTQFNESDDAVVLNAARQIHELVTASGSAWKELLVPDGQSTEVQVLEAHQSNLQDADVLSLIGQLLSRENLSESTRDELEGYKEDIAEGEFTDADKRYLQALVARL